MREFWSRKSFLPAGNGCLSIIVVFFLSMAEGKPTSLLPKKTLEKFYHEMIQTGKSIGSDMDHVRTYQSPKEPEPLRNLYRTHYTAFGIQEIGMKTRVLIYSVASKGYLSVNGANVDGRGSKRSKNSIIVIESIGFNKFRLRSESSKNYICFDDRGKLQGKAHGNSENCIFRQFPTTSYYTSFRSIAKSLKWIGIRQRGTVKKASRTRRGQRSTKFVIIRL